MTVAVQRRMVIDTLYSMQGELPAFRLIGKRLREEWGAFAPKDMNELNIMARDAGDKIYVGREMWAGLPGSPIAVLQTALADIRGDWQKLIGKWPAYNNITAYETWSGYGAMSGDTAVLLQITTLDDDCRDRDVGNALRDGVLANLKKRSVSYVLTTTPISGDFYNALAAKDYLENVTPDESEFPPAVDLHYRGGGRIVGIARGYKTPPDTRSYLGMGRQPNTDVAFIRYSRDYHGGNWLHNNRSKETSEMRIEGRTMPIVLY